MFNIFEDEDFIQFKADADISHLQPLTERAKQFLLQYRVREKESLIRIVRELFTNVQEHGNREPAALKIMLSLEYLGNQRFRIIAEKEVPGFGDTQTGIKVAGEENQYRGLESVRAFADEIHFSEKGRHVTVYARLQAEKEFYINTVSDKKGGTRDDIRPSGNICLENARKFRKELLDLFYAGQRNYRFDFRAVQDIDAVGLRIMLTFSHLICEKYSDALLEIVNANRDIVNLIQMTGMNRNYRIKETA
ncbi:MAG: STAS domain-containing protein [Desulfococcaceae bacterium]|jgi:anti-anti-sigma regulatory factor/anti-sigma regulatory factor (Ser/Thr protein kinase)|nr:STAS domain-containing protein [Desulfococcaceae bacterium]